MPKIDDTGVYQLNNGYWAFRYVVTVNNKRVERKRNKDEQGNHLKQKCLLLKQDVLCWNRNVIDQKRKL